MPRPPKLDEVATRRIVLAIRGGAYIETAAALAGISKTTLYAWLKRGAREKRGPYVSFQREVEAAMAESESVCVSIVRLAANETWQAAAWYLERTRPERYGRVLRPDAPKQKEVPIEFNFGRIRGVSIEQARRDYAAKQASRTKPSPEDPSE